MSFLHVKLRLTGSGQTISFRRSHRQGIQRRELHSRDPLLPAASREQSFLIHNAGAFANTRRNRHGAVSNGVVTSCGFRRSLKRLYWSAQAR